ncbi:GGDEF domain-containing protein [Planktothrix agardhii 1806]|nr:GGDEF domain-containing protein [Planktothrix agardhii]MCF3573181.1 GGDEF domain-containing protein [Planktothrix agardhii 1805]MCF3583775.1 GGDEF domain-containing protein [Planktothrix agardhii 1803]MCF3604089.1 GGDEF domain-containing protein [Planktothrix agardhii 1804]MCF3618529.1 GGDEF domain-containing protein [Planktothrix agardhii 1806]MCP9296020.1 GGDEF domain-containing protein [Planktothrix agardhii LY1]
MREVAQAISKAMRYSTGLVARYGGGGRICHYSTQNWGR